MPIFAFEKIQKKMMNIKNYYLTAMLVTVLTAIMTSSCSNVDNPIDIPIPTDIPIGGGMDGITDAPQYYVELEEDIENAKVLFESARNNPVVEPWMMEELEMFIERAGQMFQENSAEEEEVRHMIEELKWICHEVSEAIDHRDGSCVPSVASGRAERH